MSQDLPPELEFKNVYKMAPVIEDKELRQTLPVSSQIVQQGSSGSQSIVFRIPNDQGMSHDLSSMWLSFDFQVTGLGAAYTNAAVLAGFDTPSISGAAVPFLSVADSMESLFRDVRVYVNGSELEAITNAYNLLESALQPHMNNSCYASGPGSGSYFMNVSHMDKNRLLLCGTRSDETRSHKINCAVPLRFLGVSNTRQLWPTYRLGGGQSSVEIRIQLESSTNVLIYGRVTQTATNRAYADMDQTNVGNPAYELTNIRLNYDTVRTSESYNNALTSYLASSELTLPIDTFYTTTFDFSTSGGWSNHTVSTQLSSVDAVFIAFFLSSELNSPTFSGTDRLHFPTHSNGAKALREARVLLNGKSVPNVPIRFDSDVMYHGEAYSYLLKALKQNVTSESIGALNAYKEITGQYQLATDAANATDAATLLPEAARVCNYQSMSGSGLFYSLPRTGLAGSLNANLFARPETRWDSPTSFVIGIPVNKSDYASDYELSGSDLSKGSGLLQVQLLTDAPTNPATARQYTMLVAVRHKRVLSIGLDTAQVVY